MNMDNIKSDVIDDESSPCMDMEYAWLLIRHPQKSLIFQ